MESWNLQDTQEPSTIGQRLGKEAGKVFDSLMSIYRELYSRSFSSPTEIQQHFKNGSSDLFTPEQSESIYRKLETPSRQMGGSRDTVINDAVNKILDMISGVDTSSPDPRVGQTIQAIQFFIRSNLPLVYTLNTLENSPLFGDLLGASLDITAASLPLFASISQTQVPILFGLLPLPYASTVGLVAGWLISFFFLFLAMVIGVSRRDFSSAVEATAGMIPVLGPVAMRLVSSGDRTATKLRDRMGRIQESIRKVYGSAANAVDTAQKIANGELPSQLKSPQVAGYKTLKSRLRVKHKKLGWKTAKKYRRSKKH